MSCAELWSRMQTLHSICFLMPLLLMQVYGWPFGLTRKFNVSIRPYKTRVSALWAKATRCCRRRQGGQHAAGVVAHV